MIGLQRLGRLAPAAPAFSPWLLAMRPRTLGLSVVPVMTGTTIAWAETGRVHWPAAVAAGLAAMLIQVATNLHNDAADFERGGDGPGRLGPPRVTALGLLRPGQVKAAAGLCAAGAALAGLSLVALGGWPILALGLLSILAGWGYSGGKWPIAYTPLGELFVLAFFGLGAVTGTTWLHTGTLDGAAALAGLAVGLFAAAVLLVNNHRDAEADAAAGRRTLAILAGPRRTLWIYAALMLLPFALLAPLGAVLPTGHPWLALGALPLAMDMIRRLAVTRRGRALNALLARTAQVQLAYALLLCAGLAWAAQ